MFVLIGLIDQAITRSENVGWDTNKVGGPPIWLTTPPEPDGINPRCQLCGGPQSLVTQLYCPLGGSAFHRCLYVFACPNKCNSQIQGWRVFRSMQYDSSYDTTCDNRSSSGGQTQCEQKEHMDVGSWGERADDWGEGADDWGEGADDWGDDETDDWCCSESETDVGKAAESEDLTSHLGSAMAAARDKRDVTDSSRGWTPTVSSDMQHLTDNFSTQMNIVNNCGDIAVSQVLNEENIPPAPPAGLNADFDADSVLVADVGRLDAMANILNTKLEGQTSEAPPGQSSASTPRNVMFKSYYLEVVEEPAEEGGVSDHVMSLLRDYERSEGRSVDSLLDDRPKSGKGKAGHCEGYEKSDIRHGDKRFHKFLKRLQRCPQQCVRYDRGGDPLLVSEFEGQPVHPCPACGAERIFELQLLPALIPWLQGDGSDCDVEVDFGTVLVFTCKNNCWRDKSSTTVDGASQLMEEVIVLQTDPDRHLYR